jgi:membrane protease YdiL (CAAX protease family)
VLEDAFPGLFASKTETMLRTAMLRGALVIVLVPVLLRYLAKVPFYQLGIHCRHAGSYILYGALQTIALLPLVIAINGVVQLLWPRQTLNPVQDFFFSTSASTSEWLMVLLSAALIAPLQEELLFRSILQTWLVNRVGIIVGILIAATLFGLAHSSSWPDPVPLIVLGFALGLTYQKTRSLWAPVAMHSAFNGLMVFFSSYNPG